MKVLVVGNAESQVKVAIDIATSQGANIFLANNIDTALSHLRDGKGADLILFDINLELSIFIKKLENELINSKNIIAYGIGKNTRQIVDVIKSGAKDFLPLPPDEEFISKLFTTISQRYSKPMICTSPVMQEVLEIAKKVARSNAHILITGKSGTGKELISNYIHSHSIRSKKSFVRINCAAIPENLLESELFGYEKGAFTGAIGRRIGKFEESSGGTLLLDEISEMDIRLQAKLLRAIQEQEIDRIGGKNPIKIDLRIIATSNRDLEEEVKKGKFREDLYFRINVINIHLPELKDRSEDIISLADSFIEKYASVNKMQKKILSESAIKKLQHHQWPGNIRELENVIHRAVLLTSSNLITAEDLMLKDKYSCSKSNDYLDANDIASLLGISIENLKSKLEIIANTKQENK